jgi:hypothetical protein
MRQMMKKHHIHVPKHLRLQSDIQLAMTFIEADVGNVKAGSDPLISTDANTQV